MNFGLIILAGGKSSRMGRDKAFLEWQEKTFIEHILEKAKQAKFHEIVIVTNQPEKFEFLDVEVISDIYSQMGPLSGIHAGLIYNQSQYNLVIPCDMPFIDFSLVKELEQYSKQDYQAIVPMKDGKHQPLMAIYSKDCIKPIEKLLLIDQERKIMKLLERVATKFVAFNDAEENFFNVNTPKEFLIAQAKAANRKRRIPLVSIVASQSGTGKTTFITKLIPELKTLGFRVAVVKSDGHGFEMDKEGKDTWQFTKAGAEAIAIVSPDKYAIIQQTKEKESLENVIALIQNVDLILIESRSKGIFPVLEIARAGVTESLISKQSELVAVITDQMEFSADKIRLPLNASQEVARFIVEIL
ncbi:molybdopterin-guanine dinucleotide biosynthesis protein B [Anaerosinus massiliensis]|uniref:molybdopterin-guanine dinucleotide biosynthesis protein B n=1 Tax=Massilibacillus massiliensis TaxID=1806837 RepID=UPI000AE3E036|nr:molybdopterin-guanine dinucleotide biosynthesis protein B [Massilibacillus massiliensis]